ncbi:MAG: glycosyltransferase [Terriglobales bacterium]
MPSPAADSAGVLDAHYVLRELCRKHEVTLLSFASAEERKHIPGLQTMCREVVALDPPALPRSGQYFFYTGLSFASKLPAIARMSHSKPMVQALRERITRGAFDLVHVEFTQMAHYVELIDDVPAILDESDIAFVRRERFAQTTESRAARLLLNWDTRKLKEYEIRYCGRFQGILVRTDHDKQLLQSFLPAARIEIFPPWVDLSFAGRVREEPKEENLLFYGAMWRTANEQAVCYFVKQILPRIRAGNPEVKFTVLGSRPSERLRRMQGEKVCVTGYVEDVALYYSRACVVVVPLRSGSGIKGKIVQALACGKPVVTTSVGAEGIPAAERDGLFIRDDPQPFAECVRWLLEQRRYLDFREPARQFVRRFYDWKAGVERLENLCVEVMHSARVVHH